VTTVSSSSIYDSFRLAIAGYTFTKINLEYGKDMADSLPGIAESMGYFRGVLAGLR